MAKKKSIEALRAVGRPKSQLSDLPKDWKDIILSDMSEGASKEEIKGTLGISNDLFDRWMLEEPEFSGAIRNGETLSRTWWEKKARTSLKARFFQTGLWSINMRNRFGWMNSNEPEKQSKQSAEESLSRIAAALEAGDG